MELANVNTINGQNYILVTENYDNYRQIMFEFRKVLKHHILWIRNENEAKLKASKKVTKFKYKI